MEDRIDNRRYHNTDTFHVTEISQVFQHELTLLQTAGSHLLVSTEVLSEALLNLHLTLQKHKEMSYILLELIQYQLSQVKVLYYLVIRLVYQNQVLLIELMLEDCSLF